MIKKTQSFSAVLFDLDGTLLDTAPDFYQAICQLRKEEGLAKIPYLTIRNSVSDGAAALIDISFAIERKDPAFEALQNRLLDYYLEHIGKRSQLFEQLEEVLSWLERQSLPWGIVTNKPERFTKPLLEATNLSKRCQALVCPDQVKQRKPHPESLLLACKKIHCQPENTIYVGDHRRDIEAGNRANMKTIAATYGYIHANDDPSQWNANYLANSGSELLTWLQQHS
ncbi:MAG: HAD-IA family hydrolase [Motiliproteus sp.]